MKGGNQQKMTYEEELEHIARLRKQERLSYEEAEETLTFEDSYSRLERMLQLYCKMHRTDWLRLMGEMWSICDNLSTLRGFLRRALGTTGPLREMMDEEEQAAYDALPETITVYRGCGLKNVTGASWTTDKAVAEKFPFLPRYTTKVPLLVTGRVKKKNVLAVKLDRNEEEIITYSARKVDIESLAVPAWFTELWATKPAKEAA